MKSLAFVERLAFVKCYCLIHILCPIGRTDIMFHPKIASRGASRGLSTATLIYAPSGRCEVRTPHGEPMAWKCLLGLCEGNHDSPKIPCMRKCGIFCVMNLDMLLKKLLTFWWFGRPKCTCKIPVITFIHNILKLSEYSIKPHHIPSVDHNQMIMIFAITIVVVPTRSSLSSSSSISSLAGDCVF